MNLKIRAPHTINGTISLPASKSISNRMLLIRQLANGQITLHNISDCDDTFVMQRALKGHQEIKTDLTQKVSTIDIMAAGTAMRFLTAYFASSPCEVVITGTERMRQRPIGVLVDALRSLGADITYDEKEGFPPLRIRGHQLDGGEVSIPGNVSSQFISALLMIAPTMRRGLTLNISGGITSRPYIDITLSLMRQFGITIDEPNDHTFIIHPGQYNSGEYTIENDWSAASYWYEMLALADDGCVELEGLFKDSLQGDACVSRLFKPLGIETTFNEQGVVLKKVSQTKPDLADYESDLSVCPDLAQTMVATCCGMKVPFRFSGLHTLRIKETDRLTALQQELAKLGYEIKEENGDVLQSNKNNDQGNPVLRGVSGHGIETYNDHRMAMCMAPLSILHPGLEIQDAEVVTKSYPTFWDDLKSVGFSLS